MVALWGTIYYSPSIYSDRNLPTTRKKSDVHLVMSIWNHECHLQALAVLGDVEWCWRLFLYLIIENIYLDLM